MSELSRAERAGCAKLLQLMPKSDVVSLCQTVTNKAIVVEQHSEAIETILAFTKNAEELLKRRRVHRDLIFKYLVSERVAMPPNSDKHQLMSRCLELWSPRPVSSHVVTPWRASAYQESKIKVPKSPAPLTTEAGFSVKVSSHVVTPRRASAYQESEIKVYSHVGTPRRASAYQESEIKVAKSPALLTTEAGISLKVSSHVGTPRRDFAYQESEIKVSSYVGTPQRAFTYQESEIKVAQSPAPVTTEAGFDPLVLGSHFCRWFFELLNSQNPHLGQQPQDWGPKHFWPDVKMQVSRVDSGHMEAIEGAELVSNRLLAMTREELVFFNPNLDAHGLIAAASPHGLVCVAVAGTVHRTDTVLGIFEQIFGLARSPLENNTWKIKLVQLQIVGQNPGTNARAPTVSMNQLQLLCNQ